MRLFTDNPDFYPTPSPVIEQMMMGEDFYGKTILEPSAGSGNIVDWLQSHGAGEVIACELDPTLRKVLYGKCHIIAEDFLSVTAEQVSHVQYIVMNPPFSEGIKHILHAWEIAPAGCTVIALCNSTNVNSGYSDSKYKRQLIETIDLYGHSELLGNVFSQAERRTEVSVALVKLYKEGQGTNEFDGYFFSQYDEDAIGSEKEGLMQYNFVRDIVGRYVSAVKMFDGVMNAAKEINEVADFYDYKTEIDEQTGETRQVRQTYGYLPIKFGAMSADDKGTSITHQQYKKALLRHYWRIIFKKLNMEKYATQKLREQINRFIETQTHIPFTMANIYRVVDMVIQTNGQRMLNTLVEAFDLICSYSAENSTAGEKWKTNANYMVNRRFIVPDICKGYSWYKREPEPYVELSSDGTNRMEDICKALCNLTGRNYDTIRDLRETCAWSRYPARPGKPWGQWFEWGFFRVRCYKKGTMHVEFLDEDVWYKFNYEVAKRKGWNLPKKTPKKGKK